MEDTIGLVVRSMILSFMMSVSCLAYFETIVPRRKFRYRWTEYTAVLAFMAGFMVIAVTEIPPYILQPVRVIAVLVVAAQFYFQIGIVENLVLSVMYCGIYWIVSTVFFALASMVPAVSYGEAVDMTEPVLDAGYLCLMIIFRCRYRNRIQGITDIKWGRFGFFSLAGIIVSMALTVGVLPPDESMQDYYVRFIVVVGFAMVYAAGFYYMASLLEKESQMQKLRLLHERTQNQMNLYQGMKRHYEQQRRYQHDYRNQLNCIKGLIGSGETEEALEYISKLTGNFRQNEMCVNTEHKVVNVVLNQKYAEACDKGIAMTIVSNDLSGLTVCEEDIVTLLGNLLDNAIEACEKLEKNRVIQFKMVLEEGQLVLSVRNPVREPVKIRDNRIVTSKREKSLHGIGLLNVDSVIRKNGGTGVLQCEDGWFSFAAMIPVKV